MISWIIIAVLVILGIFAIKANHLRHRFFIIVLIVIALFFYLTVIFVNSSNNLNFSTSEGIFNSMRVYGGWLANGFSNVKQVTGEVIKMDWKSTNGSFFNNTEKENKTKNGK